LPLLGIYVFQKSRNKEKPAEPLRENIFIDPKVKASFDA